MENYSLYKNGFEKELQIFGKEHNDIDRIYIGKGKDNEINFIIIMDDSVKDWVLDYNEFGFYLKEKYPKISDFMVIDKEYLSAIQYLLSDIKIIFKR